MGYNPIFQVSCIFEKKMSEVKIHQITPAISYFKYLAKLRRKYLKLKYIKLDNNQIYTSNAKNCYNKLIPLQS